MAPLQSATRPELAQRFWDALVNHLLTDEPVLFMLGMVDPPFQANIGSAETSLKFASHDVGCLQTGWEWA